MNGPLRGKLTRGETVRFMVKVDGEMVERVVTPEELIGESEPAGVRVFSFTFDRLSLRGIRADELLLL